MKTYAVRLKRGTDLLQAIEKEAAKQGIRQDIFLEVNVGREESKSGFLTEEVLPLLEHIGEFPNIFVRGLMAIPPISQNSGDNRKFFQEMLQLSVDITAKKYDNVSMDFLSMGMTDDYLIDLHHYLFPDSRYKVEYRGYFDDTEKYSKED